MMFGQLLAYCKDPCTAAMFKTEQCKFGKEYEKLCDATGDCETMACDLKAKCENAEVPEMFKDEPDKFTEGRTEFLTAEGKCGLCTTTSTGTRQMLSGLATALLYAAFALQ